MPSVPNRFRLSIIALALICATGLAFAAGPPMWAYGFPTPAPAPGAAPAPPAPAAAPATPAAPDTNMKHLAGSPGAFTRQQISTNYIPAARYPAHHTPLHHDIPTLS